MLITTTDVYQCHFNFAQGQPTCKALFKRNMDLATDVYLNRVDQCPCGESVIHLLKGADSSALQERRTHLLVYLKGSKKSRVVLHQENPDLYNYFEMIWNLRESHMVKHTPVQYAFFLTCCFKKDCCHPLCQIYSEPEDLPTWYDGGPLVNQLPMPIPDSSRPWGDEKCEKCNGVCSGHFLSADKTLSSGSPHMNKPPSVILNEKFMKLSSYPPL